MIDTDKYEGHTPAPWEEGEYIPSDEMIERFQNRELQGAVMQRGSNFMLAMIGLDGNGEKDRLLIADAPLLLAEVKRLQEEVRWLRDTVCLLEDSRITNMSILDRPELFADVAEVFRQRKEDTHGHLPLFEGDD